MGVEDSFFENVAGASEGVGRAGRGFDGVAEVRVVGSDETGEFFLSVEVLAGGGESFFSCDAAAVVEVGGFDDEVGEELARAAALAEHEVAEKSLMGFGVVGGEARVVEGFFDFCENFVGGVGDQPAAVDVDDFCEFALFVEAELSVVVLVLALGDEFPETEFDFVAVVFLAGGCDDGADRRVELGKCVGDDFLFEFELAEGGENLSFAAAAADFVGRGVGLLRVVGEGREIVWAENLAVGVVGIDGVDVEEVGLVVVAAGADDADVGDHPGQGAAFDHDGFAGEFGVAVVGESHAAGEDFFDLDFSCEFLAAGFFTRKIFLGSGIRFGVGVLRHRGGGFWGEVFGEFSRGEFFEGIFV